MSSIGTASKINSPNKLDSKYTDPWSRFNHNKTIIRPRELPSLIGISRTTIWRLERKGDFPRRIRLSTGTIGYRLEEIYQWINSRQSVGEY